MVLDLTEKENVQEDQGSLDSWDDYISGNFLKAVNVDSPEDAFVVTEVSLTKDIDNTSQRVRLHLERNQQEFDFDLNKTNATKVKELGVSAPKDLIGKKIFFKKILTRNPKTQQEVEGLRVTKISEA